MATKKKIKKNDPCPCGSGKKYRDCCGLDAGRIKLENYDSFELEMAFDRMLEIREKMWSYLETLPEFLDIYDMAREEFEGIFTESVPDILVMYEEIFRDWLCFDFMPEGESNTLAAAYLWAGKLRAEERKILQAMMLSHMGLYQVVNKAEELCLLEDLLNKQLHIAFAGELIEGEEIRVGDILALRLFKLKEGCLLSVWDWKIDPDFIDMLVDNLLELKDLSPCADINSFLKANSLLLVELLEGLNDSPEVPSMAMRRLFCSDPVELEEKLQAESSFVRLLTEDDLLYAYRWHSDICCPNLLLMKAQQVFMMSCEPQDLEYGVRFMERWGLSVSDKLEAMEESEAVSSLIMNYIQECVYYRAVFEQIEMELGVDPREAGQDPWGRYQVEKMLSQLEYFETEYLSDSREEISLANRRGFTDAARSWLGIGTMEEDQVFMLVPRVIEDMLKLARIDNRICIDPDRYYWSRSEYAEVGQLLFERLAGKLDELSLSLLLHAWDEYAGIYLPKIEEPMVQALMLILVFAPVLADRLEMIQACFPEEELTFVPQIGEPMKAHFAQYPLGYDDLDEYLDWDDMDIEAQAIEISAVCEVLTDSVKHELSTVMYEQFQSEFWKYIQAGPVSIVLQGEEEQFDFEFIFHEWLAINAHEEGCLPYWEQAQARYGRRLIEAEKRALPIVTASQLRWVEVQNVRMEDMNGVFIDVRELESGAELQLYLFDFMGDEDDLDDQVLLLRVFKLNDDISLAMDPILWGNR